MEVGLATDGWKGSLDDYRHSAEALVHSMQLLGFDTIYPVPVDPVGELLNGSHRVACALALGIAEVPVERHATMAWAPDWDYMWFARNGMDTIHLSELQRVMEKLRA